MNIIKLIANIQSPCSETSAKYIEMVCRMCEGYLLKRYLSHSPYDSRTESLNFASTLCREAFTIIGREIIKFKLKSYHRSRQLEIHLWRYLQTVADSTLDRALLTIYTNEAGNEIGERAFKGLREKYCERIRACFSERLSNVETVKSCGLNGFELEDFLAKESLELTGKFFKSKFSKVVANFNNERTAIFRNYLESALNNFFIDYLRGENIKRRRRVIIYRRELPGELFEQLKTLEGYGNLFYYKKRYDCLSIRDIEKALQVLKKLRLPESTLCEMRNILRQKNRQAEYQRTIDNLTGYIREHCPNNRCLSRLLPKYVKTLLYIDDRIMLNNLKCKESHIKEGRRRLKNCLTCLKVEPESLHLL